MPRVVKVVWSAGAMLAIIVRYRRILTAITRVEIAKRYSGSAFGKVWVILYPALLLATYLFVYLVIFKMRFPDYSQFDYVLYVFSGLVPFLGVSEALGSGCTVLKQNLHLVKNVMLPIELVPVRSILVSMVSQAASLGVLIGLLALNGNLSLHLAWLPLVLGLQVLLLIGLVLFLSSLTLLLPDVSYFVNLALLFLMFVSPIGFKPDMVPPALRFIVYINPIHYLTEVYRCALLWGRLPGLLDAVAYVTLCLGSFALGSAFFRKFKDVLVDYE
ncbi:MAG TPA: ABC transporter permease [Gemmataceae bacterium]|nr:ABC transporter permease [Gemmataceae bacterium]